MPSPGGLDAEVRIFMVSTVSRDNSVAGVHMLELETTQRCLRLHPQHQFFVSSKCGDSYFCSNLYRI